MAKLTLVEQIILVESAVKGDSDAFSTLHDAYDQALRRTLTAFTRYNVSVVDDLSQMVWMQIFRKLSQYKGDAEFSTWATRIAINTALMAQRAGRRDRLNDSIEEMVERNRYGFERRPELQYTDPDFIRTSERKRMLEAIDKLPPYARRVLYLRLAGYDLKESAEALGITVGATKSYIHRGTKLLAGMMGISTQGEKHV